ncbi:MAG: hypothetical protein OXT65_03950, partial [Alphaproteobacteria bacterium]|nr:hypothetical protein [Alphaproteobacteria bacterium]
MTMLTETFSRVTGKETGKGANALIDAILEERPDLRDQMVYVPAQGKMAYTIIIGDEVFKAPKSGSSRALASFQREHEILAGMQGKVSGVPQLLCTGKKTCFYSMTRIPGVHPTDVRSWPEDKQTQLGRNMG